jgi:hypothetical protein
MWKRTHGTESLLKVGVQVLNDGSMGSQRLIGGETMKQGIQIQNHMIRVSCRHFRKKRLRSTCPEKLPGSRNSHLHNVTDYVHRGDRKKI